jgi:hypothetical protein
VGSWPVTSRTEHGVTERTGLFRVSARIDDRPSVNQHTASKQSESGGKKQDKRKRKKDPGVKRR